MNRRTFLQTSAGCAAHLALLGACASPGSRARAVAPGPRTTVTTTPFARLEQIGTGAWAVVSTPFEGARETFGNGGLIAGRNGVVAIDAYYTTDGAAWLADEARRLTGRWPTHVVLTHYHVDHASGLPAFRERNDDVRVHSTAATSQRSLGGGPVAPRATPALERAFADVVVLPSDEPTHLDLGDRTLALVPHAGHTASDVIVHDADAGLLYAGDLVWNRMFPNFTDTDPRALRRSVQWLAERDAAVLVPGHGALPEAAEFTMYVALLDELEAFARRTHAAGTPIADAVAGYTLPASLGEWMASRAALSRALAAWERVLGG